MYPSFRELCNNVSLLLKDENVARRATSHKNEFDKNENVKEPFE